jgi:HEAT repeat protein
MRVWVDEKEETILIPLDEKPQMVIVDKGLNVLKTFIHPKTREEYIYQLGHADDVPDRLDALQGLNSFTDDVEVYHAIKWSAFNDRFWAVRAEATKMLASMHREGAEALLCEIYQDKDSRVRTAAIAALAQFKTSHAAGFIERAARSDSSYVVLTTCLRTLAEIDSIRAFNLASECAGLDSYADMVLRASLDVIRRTGGQKAIPFGIRYSSSTSEPAIRTTAVGILGEHGKDEPQAREVVLNLTSDPNPSVRRAAVRVLQRWGTGQYRELLEKRKSVETDDSVLRAIEEALGVPATMETVR